MTNHQPLKITLRQYVDNPAGKGSAFLAKRADIKRGLNATYIQLIQRYRMHFTAIPYTSPDGTVTYHVKVPSGSYNTNRIVYDVIFQFSPEQTNKSLAYRNIRAFSNSPSFIFTYAYVFNQKDLLITELKHRLPNKCLTQAPIVRNPVESLGYERSTYVAARYLLDSSALTEKYITKNGRLWNNITIEDVSRRIADPNKLVEIYQHAQYNQRKRHNKPLDANVKAARDSQSRNYRAEQKNTKYVKKNAIGMTVTPKPKISAKTAKRNITNTVRPKKKI